MSNKGPSSTDDSKERRGIDSIYASFLEFATNQLLTRPSETNRLNQVEALRGHEKAPLSDEQIKSRTLQQASHLFTAANNAKDFAQKKQIISEFIQIVRSKIVEPVVTPAMVRYALTTLQEQFDNKHKARLLVVSTAEKVAIIENEIARLAKQPKADEAKASDAAQKPANTDPIEVARAALATAQKEASEALALYEQPTDIKAEHESFFKGFVHHVLHTKAKILDAITQEVQFCRPGEPGMGESQAADDRWKQVTDGRADRLKHEDTGPFTGIKDAVTDWNKHMPQTLTDKQWAIREDKTPYVPTPAGEDVVDEPQGKRQERLAEIRSLQFIEDVTKQKHYVREKEREALATAKRQLEAARSRLRDPIEKAKLRLIDFHPLAKRPHEVDDHLREEFEQLGIKQIPKNKQSKAAASWNYLSGGEVWNTDFESRNPQVPAFGLTLVDGKPAPLTRAMLDKKPLKHLPTEPGKEPQPMPLAYPPRREYCKAALAPQLQRHLELGVKKGYLVGKKGKYWEPAKDSEEMTDVMERLGRLKI